MIVGADTRLKSTLVTPEGVMQTLATVALSVDQARTLRAYERDILGALKLRADRKCRECGRRDPMEWEVNDHFIALACDCTMFSFSGPTPLQATTMLRAGPLPELVLVDAKGIMVGRPEERFTTDQARLLRDYTARVLLALGIVESTYCKVCEDTSTFDHGGVTFRIGNGSIYYACRHAVRLYTGATA